jgi:hypothetical protein
MSDFLSNLIARSFTDAPVIRPRVPSLFETSAEESFDQLQSSSGETIPAPGQVVSKSASMPVSESSAMQDTATAESIANASAARAGERMPKSDAPADQHALSTKSREDTSHASGVEKLEVETKRIGVPVDSFRDRKKNVGDTARSGQRKDFSPVEQRSSTSPPVIRVTIGRVEVRAIHPAPLVPKPAKPAPPKLSLEDYLHKRERGSR